MFDHIKFGVSNYVVSKSFFLKALEPLGVTEVTEWPPNGVELSNQWARFHCACIKPLRNRQSCTWRSWRRIVSKSKHSITRLWGASGKYNGAHGVRPNYHENYYAAFVIGPDGHNIEAVCHELDT